MKNKQIQELTSLTLKLDEYLKTIQKSLIWDGESSKKFENHYHDILDEAISINFQIHNIIEELDRVEIRKDMGLEN